jgi:hypothetical protein
MGRPKETNRPDTVFSLSTRAGEKRSGPAWPTAQGHFGPARPRRGHDDDHGATAARAAGRRPLPAMTECAPGPREEGERGKVTPREKEIARTPFPR